MTKRVNYTDDDDDRRKRDLRSFCCRLYGWSDEQAGLVDDTTDALLTAIERCAVIALRGKGDLVPIAYALHRQLLGSHRPFVVCDPRRAKREGSVRSAPSRSTSADALSAGAGGSVCIRAGRLPRDYDLLAPSRRMVDGTQLFVCLRSDGRVLDMLCPPIRIPSLARRNDLDRLVSECLAEATRVLGVGEMRIASRMHDVILWRTTTLADLEKVIFRIAALRSARNNSAAAARLGMAPVSLHRWASRRGILDILGDVEWNARPSEDVNQSWSWWMAGQDT